MEYIIKNYGVIKLEHDLRSIRSGAFGVSENPENKIAKTLLKATEELLKGLTESEPEEEQVEEKAKPTKPLLERFAELYLAKNLQDIMNY